MTCRILPLLAFIIALISACSSGDKEEASQSSIIPSDYLDFSDRDDQFTGGIRMISIQTPKGTFRVWTKRVGYNPRIKVLLLHGGPGGTHEEFSCFDGYLPQEGIEYIYYDQLGSYYSDQPSDTSLWTIERFVDEVEQVRQALDLDSTNFYLFGQSWGGMLGMEYAFRHQDHLKGLIISNMMASEEEYTSYAHEVLGPQMEPAIFAELMEIEKNRDYTNPRYMEILMQHHYTEHILRMPVEDWPESINRLFKHLNPEVYVYIQGHSEFGITNNATMKGWDVRKLLPDISVPTLMIGARYDSMDPDHMKWMAGQVQNGRFLYCPNGSHLAQYDDQKVFFEGLIGFLRDVDEGQM